MKKRGLTAIIVGAVIVIAVTVTVILINGKKKNTLFDNASPETSAMAFWYYDGSTCERSLLFDVEKEKEILEALGKPEAAPLIDWVPSKNDLPFYGVSIADKDGTEIKGLWCNGILIMGDGNEYEYDFDFAKLKEDFDWTNTDTFGTASVLPAAKYAFCGDMGWNADFLTESGEPNAPYAVEMQLVSADEEKVCVKYTNLSENMWTFGDDYGLQVKLDGKWYDIPAERDLVFNSIAHIIEPGKSQEITYDISAYGYLPEGEYRIMANCLTVELSGDARGVETSDEAVADILGKKTAEPVEEYPELTGDLEFVPLEFTGVPGDTVTTETYCFYEGEHYIVFCAPGVKIAADFPDVVERSIAGIEKVTGLKFGTETECSGCYTSRTFLDAYGQGRKGVINPGKKKIEICIVNNGTAACSYPGTIVLPDYEVHDDGQGDFGLAVIHELVHSLHYKMIGESDFTIMEGFATYLTSQILPIVDGVTKTFDSDYNFSVSEMSVTKENAEAIYTHFNSDFWNEGYVFGYHFIKYIYENYDDNFFAHYLEKAVENNEVYWQDEYRIKSAEIIKSLTSESVFAEYGEYMSKKGGR